MAAGCAAPPPPPTVSIVGLLERPAERALVAGLIAYDDGGFERAESQFHAAVNLGLGNPRDASVAFKYLAFISCAFSRLAECEADFRSAFAVNPAFRLTDAEIGHPIWGPVYRRVLAAQPPAPPAPATPPARADY